MKSNSLVQPCAGWLQFLRAVTVCYKLDGAIQIFTSARIRRCIEKYAESITTEDIFEDTDYAYDRTQVSSDTLDQILGLVMEYQNMNHENRDEISRHAPSITAALNKLLYPSYDRKADFLESVWNGSLSRATISASIYEAMLMDSVAASNCFSLLKIAMDVGCDRLSHACFEQSTRHFLTAMDLDRNGLVELPIDILKTVIQSDFLNVEKEEQVLTAICMWVEHDLVGRMDSFVDLFATGIRFSQIDYYRLANIMEMCDLVAANHAATELAAHELIQKTMGTNRENAMGMGTICRPRRPYRTMTLNNEKNLENLRTIFSSASYVEPLIMLDIPETDKENIASNIFIDGLSQGLLSPSKRLENEMFNSNNERITRRTLQNLT